MHKLTEQNIPTYMNNKLFANNPAYISNIHDQSFYQQTQLQKTEQMRKIKNVTELGLTKEQITEYVIAPIKVERCDKGQIETMRAECDNQLKKEYIENNWWKYRTNAPYKNILKDQDWKKTFKTNEDLIVHKYTHADKAGLIEEYNELLKLIEKHNGDLKVVFSASSETKHKEQYKYLQKTKWNAKYNPKEDDLKTYYEKEQRSTNKQQMLDLVIARVMDEDINEAELKQIESDFLTPKNEQIKKTQTIDQPMSCVRIRKAESIKNNDMRTPCARIKKN